MSGTVPDYWDCTRDNRTRTTKDGGAEYVNNQGLTPRDIHRTQHMQPERILAQMTRVGSLD
jgi:hypothetical protein